MYAIQPGQLIWHTFDGTRLTLPENPTCKLSRRILLYWKNIYYLCNFTGRYFVTDDNDYCYLYPGLMWAYVEI